eukprot:1181387-Prorocentrum_minimum.AAC.4
MQVQSYLCSLTCPSDLFREEYGLENEDGAAPFRLSNQLDVGCVRLFGSPSNTRPDRSVKLLFVGTLRVNPLGVFRSDPLMPLFIAAFLADSFRLKRGVRDSSSFAFFDSFSIIARHKRRERNPALTHMWEERLYSLTG